MALFDACYAKVSVYARRRLPAEAADEAVADTFIAAWATFDDAPAERLLWLYRIARGAVANQRRRLERFERIDERVRRLPGISAEDHPAEAVVWSDSFAAAVAQLSEPDRELLRLTYWESLTNAEAAAVLGCSLPAVKVRLHRARQRLRRYLEGDDAMPSDPNQRPGPSTPRLEEPSRAAEPSSVSTSTPEEERHR